MIALSKFFIDLWLANKTLHVELTLEIVRLSAFQLFQETPCILHSPLFALRPSTALLPLTAVLFAPSFLRSFQVS